MKITREMISAAHDITMRHKIVLGHDLLSKIYQAMKSASPESKPLTDEQIDQLLPEIVNGGTFTVITYGRAVARAIEAAHGIKGDA